MKVNSKQILQKFLAIGFIDKWFRIWDDISRTSSGENLKNILNFSVSNMLLSENVRPFKNPLQIQKNFKGYQINI